MTGQKTLSAHRREYGTLTLSENEINDSPIVQFGQWFSDIMKTKNTDPTAMVLSTVDSLGHPDSRVVLLKELNEDAFVFFTNYESTKSLQMGDNPYVALNFYWPEMSRQVRVRGHVQRVSAAKSDAYFASRPVTSQLSAIASPQSREISGRESLIQTLNELIAKHHHQPIMRPSHWGGYEVTPDEMEFWQGRDNRLHDRIKYQRQKDRWANCRLAP